MKVCLDCNHEQATGLYCQKCGAQIFTLEGSSSDLEILLWYGIGCFLACVFVAVAFIVSQHDGSGFSDYSLLSDDNSNFSSSYYGGIDRDLDNDFIEHSWEYASADEYLQYNPKEKRWEYAGEDEYLQYNPMEKRWVFASVDEYLQYNPEEKRWEYAGEDEYLQYNPEEKRWEYAGEDEYLQYKRWEFAGVDD